MPKEILKRGATSNILRVFLQDSTSTTGAGKTALTSASSGLIISTIADLEATATTYTSAATNVETITTLGTFAAPTASKCRFREVDATNFPGVYEIHIADARFAVASTTKLLISIQCTGVAPVFVEYQLVAVDLMDTVRFGLTALPNTAVTTNGSLITSGTGTAQLSVASGAVTVGTINASVITATSIAADAFTAAKFADSALVIGNLAGTGVKAFLGAGSITAGVVATGAIDADAIASDAITNAKIADSAITIRLSTDGTASKARIIAGSIATDVWSALVTAHTVAESFGARIIRTLLGTTVNQVTINANNHIAANVHQMQANVIDAASIATGAIDADALNTDAVTEIADGILARDIGSGTNAVVLNERTVRSALRALRNKSSIATSTLTVTTENDATTAWTAAVSSSATADPVTGIDPAGP
jgi:hypothetical protein